MINVRLLMWLQRKKLKTLNINIIWYREVSSKIRTVGVIFLIKSVEIFLIYCGYTIVTLF